MILSKKKRLLYSIITALVLLIGMLMYIKLVPIKRAENISDIPAEQIKVGESYIIDINQTYGCVWETSVVNIKEFKRIYYQIYLVPVASEEDTFIGVMVEDTDSVIENAIEDAMSQFYRVSQKKTLVGKVNRYDRFMTKVVNENVDKLGIDTRKVNILPVYINTCMDMRLVTVVAVGVIALVIIFAIGASIKREKKGRTPDSEIIVFQRKIYEGHTDGTYGVVKWHSSLEDEKDKKGLFTGYKEYGKVDKSIYSAFRNYYGFRFIKVTIMAAIVTYVIFGWMFSFDPDKWYYMFYGIGFSITCTVALAWIAGLIYGIGSWIINPMKRAINKQIKKSNYPDEYLDACLAKGTLIAPGGGFMYVTKNFMIVGKSYKMLIVRLERIVKITWCEKTEIIGDKKNKLYWLRVYDKDGNFGEIYVKWKKAYWILKFLKTKLVCLI